MPIKRRPPTKQSNNIRKLTVKEGHELFDQQARANLSMSGAEFISAYDAGKLDDRLEESTTMRVVMLLPLAR